MCDVHHVCFLKLLKNAEAHLIAATKARGYLKDQVEMAKQEVKILYIKKNIPIPPINSYLPAFSTPMSMHFSFDFAQQVGSFNILY